MQETPIAESSQRVFEIRTYTAAPGKLNVLIARFREHTTGIFDRYDMKSIGYWVPQDAPQSGNTLIYILAHDSREAARKHWAEFATDPEWQKVKAASEAGGKIVLHIDSVFADPTNFSAIR